MLGVFVVDDDFVVVGKYVFIVVCWNILECNLVVFFDMVVVDFGIFCCGVVYVCKWSLLVD